MQVAELFSSVEPQFRGRTLWRWSEASDLSSPFTKLWRGLAARRLFKVPPCREGTIHLRTSVSFPGFEEGSTAQQSASLTTIPDGRRVDN
ncbi:hypothetical protein TNCV_3488301 [Trichonephila clavipes]|nr:hypothetical protein TNCV_3488301 [Trichonephila clavipes]